jgi:hypothetical protein
MTDYGPHSTAGKAKKFAKLVIKAYKKGEENQKPIRGVYPELDGLFLKYGPEALDFWAKAQAGDHQLAWRINQLHTDTREEVACIIVERVKQSKGTYTI